MASPGRAMPALRMLEDAVKSAVTLCDVAAAWRIFCPSLSGEGGGGAAGGKRKGASEVRTDFWAACSYLPVQTGICICKYPAVHSATCYAEAKAGVCMFNGSCSELAH